MSKFHSIRTAMRNAFDNIKVMPSAHKDKSAITASKVYEALQGKAGIVNRLDWTASLSFKTAKMLNAPMFDKAPYGKL